MRTYLVVPFAEKDRAKKLGARWDAARKVWYVEGIENIDPFAEWLPRLSKAGIGAVQAAPIPRPIPEIVPKRHGVGKSAGVMTGAKAPLLSCDCLPWIGCEKCRPALEAMGWGVKV